MTQHIYTISTTDGRRHPALRETYATQDSAADALQRVMGWDEIHLSDDYTVSENSDGVSAYETEEERDADEAGAHAPRITERRLSDATIERLRDEAAEAGDLEQVATCERALAGDHAAIVACAEAIDAARAMADE